jgi:hypothetical protein
LKELVLLVELPEVPLPWIVMAEYELRRGITFSDAVVEVDVETELVEQEVDIVVVEVLEDDEVVD